MIQLCSVFGCKQEIDCKGLCQKHYNKRYAEAHKEEIAEGKKQYRKLHKEEIAEYMRQYNKDHKEKMAKYAKQYQEDNKEEITKKRKQYYNAHKKEISKRNKIYRETHKEEAAKYAKRYAQTHKKEIHEVKKRYAKVHKAKIAKYVRSWYLDNKEKIGEYQKQWGKTPNGSASIRAGRHNRRALTKDLTKEIVLRVYEENIRQYGVLTCYLCGKPIIGGDTLRGKSLEHLTPLSRGGTNTCENLGIAHISCNSKKHTKTMSEVLR